MLKRKKLCLRFMFSIGLIFFLSLASVFFWLEHLYEKALFHQMENQTKMLFTLLVLTRQRPVEYSEGSRETYQRILKEVSAHSHKLPPQVTKEISQRVEVVKEMHLLLIAGIIATVISFLFILTKNWLTKPLAQLHHAIETIGKGNFSFRLNIKTGDEIEQIAEKLNVIGSILETSYHTEKLTSLGRMLAGLAHEMNNPLTTILGYTQLCLMDIDEKTSYYSDLKKVEEEAKRLNRMIKNLLNYSRPSELTTEPVELNTLIDTSLELLHHRIKHKNVEIIKEYDKGMPIVKVNKEELKQTFVNLTFNALDALADDDKPNQIIFSTKYVKEKQNIEIKISDTGAGILPENINKIFEPFYTTKNKEKGCGLGLFVVYSIIQKHKGKIEVKSKVNEGTTFLITLPENPASNI